MDSWHAPALPALPGRSPQTRIWDTASQSVIAAAPGPDATLYACGITPYDATHLGHAATYVAWDLLVRSWRDAGYQTRYVQNVTDVDDPLLERADRDGEDWRELADREIVRYRSDMVALRVLPPDHLIGAVEALDLIGEFSRRLAGRDALYEVDGDLYFARESDQEFGSVSGLDPLTMSDLSAQRGGDPGRSGKKDPLDALVWQAQRPGEPSWDSAFGRGRPGWHVECSAIATAYLGPRFDVQAGGSDLIFPHHEFSASHARVAFGETSGKDGGAGVFARCYAHSGMVRLDGEKMSKSRGNLVFVSALLAQGADPMAVRLAIMAHHYRGDWDWTDDALAAATHRLACWRAAALAAGVSITGHLGPAAGQWPVPGMPVLPGGAPPSGESVLAAMRERLADDLDAPGALAAVDAWASRMLAASSGQPGPAGAAGDESARLVVRAIDALLGVAL